MSEQIEHTVAVGPGLHAADRDRRQAMVQALAGAVGRGELSLHYQPQVDLRNGAMYGVEALLRWHSPEFGAVWPAEFIPLAEQHELIVEIGAEVFGPSRLFIAYPMQDRLVCAALLVRVQ